MAVPVLKRALVDVESRRVQARPAARAVAARAQPVKAALDLTLVKAEVFAGHAEGEVHHMLLAQQLYGAFSTRSPSGAGALMTGGYPIAKSTSATAP